ncbi:UDP-N-acetylmuramoyl-L-alanyl-D-glutamate--2,6-diaminopimelate ligase [Haliovirga abyssi]|uniref:UDP-N-acetylmuramoyl-L-alanyl-D-glutamate--2,6-diaminopimelate ligase n=1 Tax=Haliovirga abyssi TaxID=2996794 RepID=A0AAU9DTX7_9FUSO|nr:UDP-N-acetylmuramoyl-L-alanyl-D-glutamate--2,6-diaminopimelate ligase [Haliovirga abyssi]BDU50664.1 UDP-N-acetylmuramoyl-L-alanyl-D-glutamate--2,6-diaminopimelate ligase [Haliovirga abyssi]
MEKLFKNIEFEILNQGEKTDYNKMEYDSRKIDENDIFVALEGFSIDGHNFIETAINNGCKMVIVSKKVEILDEKVTYIKVNNLRKRLGIIASNFYDWPQKKLKIIGITGTNGKTTTTYLIEEILGKVARFGTIEYKIGDEIIAAPNTTPESLDVVKMCKKAIEKNIEYLIMEVSSHSLELGRVDMLEFDVAIFTNLTQDHLDFHGDMENYFLAKEKLFSKLKEKSNAIINIDDEFGKRLYNKYSNGISYSNINGDIVGKITNYTNHNMILEIDYIKKSSFETKLMGKFNLYNIMAAFGAGIALGFSEDVLVEKLSNAKRVPGRFETISENQNFMVVVDYAHTEDGLLNILSALEEIKKSKIITIFGAGGDRDKTKRAKMAKAAAKFSDFVIITSDNPRTENPVEILNGVEQGMKDIDYKNYEVIENRELAIKKGIEIAMKNDIVLIAGKGHEDYQIIGKEKIHFDDREIARKFLKEKK